MDRKTYMDKMESQLNELGTRMNSFMGRLEKDARKGYERLSEEFEEKQQTARSRLTQLRHSSGQAWQDLRPGLEEAWEDLRSAFQKAASRF